MQTQGLTVDKCLHACPQPQGLPTSGTGEFCHYDCTECRLVPGGGPVDHPASHWDEVTHTGAHQVEHAQKERASLEENGTPGVGCGALQLTSPTFCVYSVLGCPRLSAPPV